MPQPSGDWLKSPYHQIHKDVISLHTLDPKKTPSRDSTPRWKYWSHLGPAAAHAACHSVEFKAPKIGERGPLHVLPILTLSDLRYCAHDSATPIRFDHRGICISRAVLSASYPAVYPAAPDQGSRTTGPTHRPNIVREVCLDARSSAPSFREFQAWKRLTGCAQQS